jgi:phytoene synthase
VTSGDAQKRPHPAIDEAVKEAARSGEPDRYLAALLAPPPARPGLLALAAFSAELARIPRLVTREPHMGEIRLQWWRDSLEMPAAIRTGNPIADALREAVEAHALPIKPLLDMIAARSLELGPEPLPDEEALYVYLDGTQSASLLLAARLLGGTAPNLDAVSRDCGRCYGMARLLMELPHALSAGRVLLPLSRLHAVGLTARDLQSSTPSAKVRSLLADARAEVRRRLEASRHGVANLPRLIRIAFLPLALVSTYVRALERVPDDSLSRGAEISPLIRITRIAAAHWFGRI